MKLFTVAYLAAAVGFALVVTSCKPCPAVAGTEPSTAWEKVGDVPKESGLYLIRNNETGQLCHVAIDAYGNGHSPSIALDCDYMLFEDGSPDAPYQSK